MFEIVDGRTDAGVTGILLANPWAFGSGELKKRKKKQKNKNTRGLELGIF